MEALGRDLLSYVHSLHTGCKHGPSMCCTLVQVLASDWVKHYEKNPESALLELVQFFVMCCGCRVVITMDMFCGETSDTVHTITENSLENAGEYPLILPGSNGKKFRVRRMSEFR